MSIKYSYIFGTTDKKLTYPQYVSLRTCLIVNDVNLTEVSEFVESKIKKKLCNITTKEACDLMAVIGSGEYEKWKLTRRCK